MARQRHRKSSVDRLPADIRQLIGRLRSSGRTIAEILAHLRGMDVQVGRTALAKHTRQLDDVAEHIRRSRLVGEALIERLGDAPDSRQARANIEMMHALIMQLLAGEHGEPVELTPQSAKLLSDALAKLAAAAKADAERDLQLRQRLELEAAGVVERVATREGLSPEVIAKIRATILGVGA